MRGFYKTWLEEKEAGRKEVPVSENTIILKYLKETLTKIPQDTGYYSTSKLINKIRKEFLNELIKEIKIQSSHQP